MDDETKFKIEKLLLINKHNVRCNWSLIPDHLKGKQNCSDNCLVHQYIINILRFRGCSQYDKFDRKEKLIEVSNLLLSKYDPIDIFEVKLMMQIDG